MCSRPAQTPATCSRMSTVAVWAGPPFRVGAPDERQRDPELAFQTEPARDPWSVTCGHRVLGEPPSGSLDGRSGNGGGGRVGEARDCGGLLRRDQAAIGYWEQQRLR